MFQPCEINIDGFNLHFTDYLKILVNLLTSENRFQFLLKRKGGAELFQDRAKRVQLNRHELNLLLRSRINGSAIDGNLGQIVEIAKRKFWNVRFGEIDDAKTERRRGDADELSTVEFDDEMSDRSGHVVAVGEVLSDGGRVRLKAGHAASAEVEVVFDGRHSGHERQKIEKFFDVDSLFDVVEDRLAVDDDGHVLGGSVANIVLECFSERQPDQRKYNFWFWWFKK